MEAITFKSGTLVINFINMLRTAKNDIEAVGGKYDNAHMVVKLSCSLLKDYDNFISTKIEIVDKMPEFDKIISDLLIYKSYFVS